jgi:hypothetical protein
MIRIALIVALFSSGCIVHRHPPARTQRVVVVKEKCHPSQYWDGAQCRHKGKGWGARKHDGR